MGHRRSLWVLTATTAITTLVIAILVLAGGPSTTPPTRASTSTSPQKATSCLTDPNLNDYQMNQCLVEQIGRVRSELTVALRRETVGLSAVSNDSSILMAGAEADFERFASNECLAEASPYTGGTIYPIIFGNCKLSLYGQRLRWVNQAILNFPGSRVRAP